ncbi:MAG: hypothetical protein ACYCW6_02150, partial [Candidatus Xenobia bacterium]
RLHPGLTWEELWQRNRGLVDAMEAHQWFPALNMPESPQAEFLFQFQKYQQVRWAPQAESDHVIGSSGSPLGRLTLKWLEIPCAPFPVCMETFDLGEALAGMLRYRITAFRFPSQDAARLVERLQRRVDEAVEHPSRAIEPH